MRSKSTAGSGPRRGDTGNTGAELTQGAAHGKKVVTPAGLASVEEEVREAKTRLDMRVHGSIGKRKGMRGSAEACKYDGTEAEPTEGEEEWERGKRTKKKSSTGRTTGEIRGGGAKGRHDHKLSWESGLEEDRDNLRPEVAMGLLARTSSTRALARAVRVRAKRRVETGLRRDRSGKLLEEEVGEAEKTGRAGQLRSKAGGVGVVRVAAGKMEAAE